MTMTMTRDGDDKFGEDIRLTLEEDENDHNDEDRLLASTTSTSRWWWSKNLSLLEVSGSCGDFGTLIPLLVALARQRSIYLAPTLLGTGVVHIVNGIYWDIPMPLQPMKSIAALAIAQELSREQVITAGMGMGVLFLILGCFKGVIECLHRWIPKSLIGGLQLGVGWKLALKGIHMIQELPWWGALDGIVWSVVCSILCLYWLRRQTVVPSTIQSRRSESDHDIEEEEEEEEEHQQEQQTSSTSICYKKLFHQPPVGLYLFGLGLLLAGIQLSFFDEKDGNGDPNIIENEDKEAFVVNALKNVSWDDWRVGLLHGTLPQLPLTTLNSCLSVCLLAQTLYPDRGGEVQPILSRRSVCLSIGMMNLFLCPLGCMPNCHGAGGLAGQHRLGARRGVSMIVLGCFKIFLSILAHQGALLVVLDALPVSILGVLLVLAGNELAATGVRSSVILCCNNTSSCEEERDRNNEDASIMICLITALLIVGTEKTHVGAICGWITFMIYGNGYEDLVLCWQR